MKKRSATPATVPVICVYCLKIAQAGKSGNVRKHGYNQEICRGSGMNRLGSVRLEHTRIFMRHVLQQLEAERAKCEKVFLAAYTKRQKAMVARDDAQKRLDAFEVKNPSSSNATPAADPPPKTRTAPRQPPAPPPRQPPPSEPKLPEFARVLGLTEWPSTAEAVKKAFQANARAFHPDAGGAHHAFIALTEAYHRALRELKNSK